MKQFFILTVAISLSMCTIKSAEESFVIAQPKRAPNKNKVAEKIGQELAELIPEIALLQKNLAELQIKACTKLNSLLDGDKKQCTPTLELSLKATKKEIQRMQKLCQETLLPV